MYIYIYKHNIYVYIICEIKTHKFSKILFFYCQFHACQFSDDKRLCILSSEDLPPGNWQ